MHILRICRIFYVLTYSVIQALRFKSNWLLSFLVLCVKARLWHCAFVSVLEEYNGHRRPGHIRVVYILHILHILRILHISRILHTLHILDNLKLFCTEWLDTCQSTIVFERRESEQVLYVVPVSSILGRLPLVPVGSTGTIPFEMRRESADFPGAACDKSKDAGDEGR